MQHASYQPAQGRPRPPKIDEMFCVLDFKDDLHQLPNPLPDQIVTQKARLAVTRETAQFAGQQGNHVVHRTFTGMPVMRQLNVVPARNPLSAENVPFPVISEAIALKVPEPSKSPEPFSGQGIKLLDA